MERTSVGPGDLGGEGGLLAPRDAGAERVGDLDLGRCPPQGRTPRRCVVNAVVVEFNKRTNDTGLFEARAGRKVDNIEARQNGKELQHSCFIFTDEETEAHSGCGTCIKSQSQISQVVKSKVLTVYRCHFQVAGTLGCVSLLYHL